MAKDKKDGRYLHCFIESQIMDALEGFCAKTGLTKTSVVEKALGEYIGSWSMVYLSKGAVKEETVAEETP